MSVEPKIDIKKLEEDMLIESGRQSKVRDGLKKMSIRGEYNGGEYDIEFWDKSGVGNCIEVKWCGHIDRVDMRIKNKPYWVWDYGTLRKKDVRNLIRWLVKIEKRLF